MTTDELLAKMAALLHMQGRWQARATGANAFHDGATPREAMLRALGLWEAPAEQRTRRRISFD